MNDNERQGLPADIDLVSTSIANLLRKPGDLKRLENLRSCLIRLLSQVDRQITDHMRTDKFNPDVNREYDRLINGDRG
ncbi:hypothetical protein Ares1_0077 [Vibrio phage Ares1]|nr:hypothetical protein Ares1_0077 [Vibrio phage Ares1]